MQFGLRASAAQGFCAGSATGKKAAGSFPNGPSIYNSRVNSQQGGHDRSYGMSRKAVDWWLDKWWLGEEYARHYGGRVSPAIMNEAVLLVSKVFNGEWVKHSAGHPATGLVLGKGFIPLTFLYELGRDLDALGDARGMRALIKDLRNPSTFESARFEFQVAGLLARAGHAIEFRPKLPNGRESDLLARVDSQRSFVEVKRIGESYAERAVSQFSMELASAVMDCVAKEDSPVRGLKCLVELDPQLPQVFTGPRTDEALIGGLVGKSAWPFSQATMLARRSGFQSRALPNSSSIPQTRARAPSLVRESVRISTYGEFFSVICCPPSSSCTRISQA